MTSDQAAKDEATRKELEERVRDAFPKLAFTRAELNAYGEDNYVLELDKTWIVRCPRAVEQQGRFIAELNLLERLRDVSPLPVPHYEFVAPDKSLAAYRRIEGAEMTPPLFVLMGEAARQAALVALGGFLSVLHALPMQILAQPDGHIQRCWSGEQFAALYRGMRRPKIARVTPPDMLARFDAFHEAFENETPGPDRLAHGDLSDDHILVREDGTIAGLIDFTDAAWGDGAIDFAYFWRLGEDAVDLVLANYALATHDPGLKSRAHWTFVRYLINQIAYGARAKWNLPPEQALAELEGHLTRLDF